MRQPPGLLAVGAYLIAALLMFAVPVLGSGHRMVGVGSDPQIFIWALGYWPHALGQGGNPFFTHLIYYPEGLDLAHGALLPGASILLWPVTALFGALSAYNVGMVLSPLLAALFAFLLCRRLTGSFWAALAGGWLYGFSPYLLGQMAGHLHLTLVFPVPAAVYIAVRAYDGLLSRGWAVAWLVIALTVLFYISAESLVSFTIFATVALGAAYVLADLDGRGRLRALGVTLGGAYAIILVLCAPYLYEALKPGQVPVLPQRSDVVSADLLSYVLPSPLTRLGGSTFQTTTAKFAEGPFEGGAYLGLPLILIVVLAIRSGWQRRWVQAALVVLVVVVVCSFGGHLHVDGHFTIPLPWAIVNNLPVIGQLLPARFTDYVFLIVAVLAAVWIAESRHHLSAGVLAVLAVAFAWPALHNGPWNNPAPLPRLFTTSAYRRYISPRDDVLILPIGDNGPSMLWQVAAHFRFHLAGGYALPPEAPTPYSDDPLYPDLNGAPAPDAGPATVSFLARHGVTLVLMQPGAPTTGPWETMLERLGWRPAIYDGVLMMRRARERPQSAN